MSYVRCPFSAACVLGILDLAAAQATLRVSPAGDDRRGDGSAMAPFASIDVALTRSATMTDGGSNLAHFVDVDSDGDLDLLVFQGNRLGMYENLGTRTAPRFLPPRWVRGGVGPDTGELQNGFPVTFQFDLEDGNGDGRPDLFVARSDGHLWFLPNQSQAGDVVFGAPAEIFLAPVVQSAGGVVLIDLDGDGRRDLLIGGLLSRADVQWMRRMGDGNPPWFAAPQPLVAGNWKGAALAYVDMDGDGRRDLVIWSRMLPATARLLNYYPNIGSSARPVFGPAVSGAMTAGWIAQADLDGDGTEELHAAILSQDQSRFDILRVPRAATGRPDVAAGVPERFDPAASEPQRVLVEVPAGNARYLTAFPLTVPGNVELLAGLPSPDSMVARVALAPLGYTPGSLVLAPAAPRLGIGPAMVVLTGSAPRIAGFELLCQDPQLSVGVESWATAPVLERVVARGFVTGFLARAGRPLLARCAASGCATAAVLQKGGTVRGCTFAGNDDGLAMNTQNGPMPGVVTDSILYANRRVDLGGIGACQVSGTFVGTIGIALSVSARNLWRSDPRLRNPRGGDLSLRPDSPAIDAAVATSELLDVDGGPRLVGVRQDVGAWEWSPVALHLRLIDPRSGVVAIDVARPAGGLPLLFVGTAANAPIVTPFGDLLLARLWPLAMPGGRATFGDLHALAGHSLAFQAFVLDPGAASAWPTNAVEWALH